MRAMYSSLSKLRAADMIFSTLASQTPAAISLDMSGSMRISTTTLSSRVVDVAVGGFSEDDGAADAARAAASFFCTSSIACMSGPIISGPTLMTFSTSPAINTLIPASMTFCMVSGLTSEPTRRSIWRQPPKLPPAPKPPPKPRRGCPRPSWGGGPCAAACGGGTNAPGCGGGPNVPGCGRGPNSPGCGGVGPNDPGGGGGGGGAPNAPGCGGG
mmetsp:Transcript_11386/g.30675  ORF Transcript_11386/g.30675 Transcript_11386/m.30675 type:complete len:214 (-) Transcript_11386:744-1385(-)